MRCTKALSPLVTGLTMVALSTEAFADPAQHPKEPPRRYRTSEILNRLEMPRGETRSWLEEHVSIRKGLGLAYHWKVETEDHQKVILTSAAPPSRRSAWA